MEYIPDILKYDSNGKLIWGTYYGGSSDDLIKCVMTDKSNSIILGGISSGQDILVSVAFKPASSIRVPGNSIDINNNSVDVVTTGRHDPCVGIRAVPIGEAMVACVVADHALRHRAQIGEPVQWPFPPPRSV